MAETKKRSAPKTYVAVVAITLPDGTRIAAGEPVPNPDEWLIEAGKVTHG